MCKIYCMKLLHANEEPVFTAYLIVRMTFTLHERKVLHFICRYGEMDEN